MTRFEAGFGNDLAVSSLGRPHEEGRGVAGGRPEVGRIARKFARNWRPELGLGRNVVPPPLCFVRKLACGVPGRSEPTSSHYISPVVPRLVRIRTLGATSGANHRATAAPRRHPTGPPRKPELTPRVFPKLACEAQRTDARAMMLSQHDEESKCGSRLYPPRRMINKSTMTSGGDVVSLTQTNKPKQKRLERTTSNEIHDVALITTRRLHTRRAKSTMEFGQLHMKHSLNLWCTRDSSRMVGWRGGLF